VFGEGPLSAYVDDLFLKHSMSDRLYKLGIIEKSLLPEAYQAMNVFAFSSKSETQGMVLTEAMAAGVPVVAVDAPGVREVVHDGLNGCLLTDCNSNDFVQALNWISSRMPNEYDELVVGARKTAREFSMKNMANRALELYSRLRVYDVAHRHVDYPIWVDALNVFESEWLILKNTLKAATDSIVE
jgi:glycosyltransferase involved in cell wall biosynthesis